MGLAAVACGGEVLDSTDSSVPLPPLPAPPPPTPLPQVDATASDADIETDGTPGLLDSTLLDATLLDAGPADAVVDMVVHPPDVWWPPCGK